ncbi:DUF5329 domain-containing protein [Massilia sp. LXY-6]|uniref:DUF5329 domain-containing protein n=1 Tax=Massilia sp. LXY-6 TaxID=3379823 RepID=UPI003EDF9AC1
MHRPRRHPLIALSTVLALCAGAPAWAQQDPHTPREIAHLLDFVAQSGCQFERNGSWHDSKAAREHLQEKYDYLQRRKLVPSTRAFIERAASQSSWSGKPYQVRCGSEQPITSAQWLNAELERYRAGTR